MSGPPAKGPYDRDRIRERVESAARVERQAGLREQVAQAVLGIPASEWTMNGGYVDPQAAIDAVCAALAAQAPAPHTLLWPPHPGDVYQSSSLCSCGEWQYDADTPGDLFNETRAVQRDWTRHVAQVPAQEPLTTSNPVQVSRSDPAQEERLRELADRIDTYCDACGGDRWTVTADPDEFGEPGEPYQIQCLDSLHACAEQVRGALSESHP